MPFNLSIKNQVTAAIAECAQSSKSPVVLLSGGVDSLLLTYLTKQYNWPVLTFMSDWTKSQKNSLKRIAATWGVTIYSFPPVARYCCAPDADTISLVDEYQLGGAVIPVVRDVQEGKTCLADLTPTQFPMFGLEFDTALVGVLESDRHPLTGNRAPIARDQKIGDLRIVAPLFDLSKADVEQWANDLRIMEFVIPETGEIAACTQCLVGDTICPASGEWLKKIDWDGQQMAAAFRDKFGF